MKKILSSLFIIVLLLANVSIVNADSIIDFSFGLRQVKGEKYEVGDIISISIKQNESWFEFDDDKVIIYPKVIEGTLLYDSKYLKVVDIRVGTYDEHTTGQLKTMVSSKDSIEIYFDPVTSYRGSNLDYVAVYFEVVAVPSNNETYVAFTKDTSVKSLDDLSEFSFNKVWITFNDESVNWDLHDEYKGTDTCPSNKTNCTYLDLAPVDNTDEKETNIPVDEPKNNTEPVETTKPENNTDKKDNSKVVTTETKNEDNNDDKLIIYSSLAANAVLLVTSIFLIVSLSKKNRQN